MFTDKNYKYKLISKSSKKANKKLSFCFYNLWWCYFIVMRWDKNWNWKNNKKIDTSINGNYCFNDMRNCIFNIWNK